MAGLRDFFRSSSKSRPPKEATVDKGKQPAAPPPPPQTEQPPAEAALPPLPLFRADSKLVKTKQPTSAEVGGLAYHSLPAGALPTKGTYPLHGNARARIPTEPDAASNFRNGSSNGPSDTRSNRSSRALERSSSKASTQARRISGVRAPSSHRRSLPPGTAVSTDEPVTRTFSFNSMTSPPLTTTTGDSVATRNIYTDTSQKPPPVQAPTRQPVQAIVKDSQREKGPKQFEDTPAVPVIPGQYRGTRPETNGSSTAGDQTRSQHTRVTSVSSKASTSSRTPIADEFASTTWYARDTSPTAPSWSPLHGEASTSLSRNASSEEDRGDRTAQQLHYQSHDKPDSQTTTQTQPSTAAFLENPFPRDRKQNKSIDRPLPIPTELKDAPWNKPVLASDPPNSSSAASKTDDNRIPMAHNSSRSGKPLENYSDIRDALPAGNAPYPTSETNSKPILSNPPPEADGTVVTRSLTNPLNQIDSSTHSRNFSKPFVDGVVPTSSVKGIGDVRNAESTTIHTERNPAVVHETVKPTIQHIREEQITREHHTHDIHHRILPIVDVQVLPAKHYVPAPSGSNGFVEVAPGSVPGRVADGHNNRNWVIAETASRLRQPVPVSEKELQTPRDFTARTFESTQGDYKEWVDENGTKRSETTWVHPPRLAQAQVESGVTVPIYMDGPLVQKQPQTQTQSPASASITQIPGATQSRATANIAAVNASNSTGSQASKPISLPTNIATSGNSGQSNAITAAQAAASKLASR